MHRVAFLLLFWVVAAEGHHGSAASYDVDNIVTIEGEVLSVSWRNPHVRMQLLRTVEGGENEVWEIESASANGLQRVGIGPEVVAVGDHVSLTGGLSRHGLSAMAAFVMTRSDGTEVALWPQRARRMGQDVERVPIMAKRLPSSAPRSPGPVTCARHWFGRSPKNALRTGPAPNDSCESPITRISVDNGDGDSGRPVNVR